MKGDFTKNTFDPCKHFLRVLMQQGRVQLDSDWNEQMSILLHYMQTLATDLIGPYAGPEGDSCGFAISEGTTGDFQIGKGRYYVNGILCENEQGISFLNQPDYPLSSKEQLLNNVYYIAYLDVWERHISYVEDDDIREKALNGADTATRSRVVWQVKVNLLKKQYSYCYQATSLLKDTLALSEMGMRARAKKGEKADEPCLTEPEARYRGVENQLYRVEIHEGNIDEDGNINDSAKVTIKFSRENGSVVFPVKKISSNSGSKICTVALEHLGRDDKLGLVVNDWVELVDDNIVLCNETMPLLRVKEIDIMERTVTLARGNSATDDTTIDPDKHALLRRWDQQKRINKNGVIEIKPDESTNNTEWIPLEDGIEVQFSVNNNARVRHGDYWLIPARMVTGDVEWPIVTDISGKLQPELLPPMGIVHHYAPLAIINVTSNGVTIQSDCRCRFKPLSYNCQYNYFGQLGIGTDLLCSKDNK